MSDTDFLIVGAGIAGASMAAELAPHARVIVVETERVAGYHATGRSAAFWHETYGGPLVQPLTRASMATLASPDPDFAEQGFLKQRSALNIARASEAASLDAFEAAYDGLGMNLIRLDRAALARRIPGLRPEWNAGIREDDCSDIDVAGLHAAYMRAARRAGAEVRTGAELSGAVRQSDGRWRATAGSDAITATTIINAGGAWADQVAEACGVAGVGVQPYRRTIVQLRLHDPIPADLPLTLHIGGEFYFKGESEGRIWLSPHDETPDVAHDVAPEEIDVAIAIDRLEGVVDWRIAAVERKWAGLRSFAPDRLPVYGREPGVPSFVWCAGQGGFGIQTAPAGALLLSAALRDVAPDASVAGIDLASFSPARFR